MSKQYSRLILIFGFCLAFFQNCAAPDVATNGKVASLASTSPAAGAGASNASAALSAAYSPVAATAGSPVTITGVGGSGQYTYSLLSGAGTLTGNKYIGTTAETVKIIVHDTTGAAVLSTIVIAATSTTPGTGTGGVHPVPTPAPTPLPTPQPSNALQVNVPGKGVMTRNCNLQSLAQDAQANQSIPSMISYIYCLEVLRMPSSGELNMWNDEISGGNADPYSVLYNVGEGTEFVNMYNTSVMQPADYMLLLARLLVMTDPTQAQMAGFVGDGTLLTQGQYMMYDTVVNSSYFNQANPILPAAEKAYLDATN